MIEFDMLFYLAVILFGGLLCGRLVKLIKLPNVTGYLIAGLLLGPYLLKVIPGDIVSQLSIIPDIALGFIAFSIGSEFKISYFKQVGVVPIVIAIFEALFAVILVVLGLLAIGCELPFALALGSIAAATAPAATIMVVKQYNAKGPVTQTLMSVVALDDAVALMAFGFASAAAKAMLHGGAFSVMSVLKPFAEIGISLGIGFALGFLFLLPLKFFHKGSNRLIIAAGFVFLAVAVSNMLNVSALLTCMAMGAVFVNLDKQSDTIMKLCDMVTPPIFLMFFVVSGAELNISIIPQIGIVGIVYIVLRVAGKMLGAFTGAKLSKAPSAVCKYLGPTLLPQAGVAIGLSLVAQSILPEHGDIIRAVILCATFIYELIGPAITKITLQKAGEIQNT